MQKCDSSQTLDEDEKTTLQVTQLAHEWDNTYLDRFGDQASPSRKWHLKATKTQNGQSLAKTANNCDRIGNRRTMKKGRTMRPRNDASEVRR